MTKDNKGIKKPGKVYWLITFILNGIFSLVFILDIILWQRYSLSIVFLIITGITCLSSYVQFKSVSGEKK